MSKLKSILISLISTFFLIIIWYLSITYAFSFGVMNMIKFVLFHIPALLILTFLYTFSVINIIKKYSFNSKKIIVVVLLAILSIVMFLIPMFLNSRSIIVENKDFFNCLSIEKSLGTDYITSEKQYYNSVYEQSKIGEVLYVFCSYEIGDTLITNEELKEDSTDIEYSLHYMKNVPKIIYQNWQKPAIFDLLYEKYTKLGYDFEEEIEDKSNNGLVNYKIYYSEETDNKCKIVVFAENGQDMLIYQLKLDDDIRGLTIDKEHIISLVENAMSEHEHIGRLAETQRDGSSVSNEPNN